MSTGTERRADDAAAGKHTGKQAVTAKASNHNHIYLDTSSSSDDDDHSLMTLGKRSTQPASHAAAGGPTPGSSPPTASPASPASPAFPRKQRAKKAAQSGADGGPPAAADMAASAQAPGGKTAVRATKRPRKAAAAQVGMTTPAAAGHDVAPTAPADNGRPRRACAAASVPAPVVESGSDEDEDGVQATPAAAAAPADKKARKAPRKLVVMRDLVWAAVDGGTPLPALITRHDAYPHSSAPYGPGAVPLTAPAARAAAEEHNRKLQQLQQQLQAQAAAAKQLEAAAAAAAAEGEVDSGDEDEGCEDCEDEPAASGSKAGKRGKAGKALVAKKPRRAASSALPGPLPAIDHPVPSLIPNLGYACLCNSLREYDIYCSRQVACLPAHGRGGGVVMIGVRALVVAFGEHGRQGVVCVRPAYTGCSGGLPSACHGGIFCSACCMQPHIGRPSDRPLAVPAPFSLCPSLPPTPPPPSPIMPPPPPGHP